MSMNDNLNKILLIDQDIQSFIMDNIEMSEEEFEEEFAKKKFVSKAIRVLNKMSRYDLIEAIKRCRYIWKFVDLNKFIKKYPINKKYLKENKDKYIEEYHKLRNTCFSICDLSNDYNEFQKYLDSLDIDNVEEYLLTNMPNEQIYALACESTDWSQKLFYFSFFKK